VVEWRRARLARPYLVVLRLASLEGNRNCFLRRRFHARTNLSPIILFSDHEGIFVIGDRSRVLQLPPPPPAGAKTKPDPPSPAGGMKSFPVDRGHNVSLALFADVSNSRYGMLLRPHVFLRCHSYHHYHLPDRVLVPLMNCGVKGFLRPRI
jgi:hypothetical protein